ncbi:hypothetical protein BFJ63_vAg18325 [Fusarium oxysporum f. sp. narcissi]|jgi:hypothetical protein|uniref:Uncharacterized protein n=5 Tax=Fusarium oxysporum TaxID=5507 RepID=W9HHM4_FUSOX|nr:hypothetical protein FOXG_14920 [Fusarium oxysporum f. sp. lycopersici 4287]EWY79701.1 hypothetical protein FOYG_17186 [Fusarium oxysporum NRRL 32931]EWZ27889.1 hypothetical protein FOZG_18402 [Fusarium oxysporum Fo47]KNB16905.1 hypothetical protein FOXG_14920 [Fusarium oxysporum f. sp. lycopersici 4287]RYC78803.1 hypothetical protein BFJ63_vAg18325 [Fusarium oxysporum f. sp. narcissi]
MKPSLIRPKTIQLLIVNSDKMTTEKPKGTVAVPTVLHHESKSNRPRRRSANLNVPKVRLRGETFHVGYTGLSDRVYIYFDKRGRANLMNPQWKQVPFHAVRLSKRYHGAKNLQALVVGVKAREADKAALSGEI